MRPEKIHPAVSAQWVVLGGIVILALLLRIIAFLREPVINRDGIVYIEIAEKWAATGMYEQHNYLPLYPWMMKLLMSCGLNGQMAGVGINILLGTALTVIVWAVLTQCGAEKKICLLAAFILAVHPYAVELSTLMVRDNLFLGLSGGAIVCWLAVINKFSWTPAVISAVLAALAFLTRYEAMELVWIFIAGILIVPMYGKTTYKKSVLFAAGWLAAVAIVLFAVCAALNTGEQVGISYSDKFDDIMAKIQKNNPVEI